MAGHHPSNRCQHDRSLSSGLGVADLYEQLAVGGPAGGEEYVERFRDALEPIEDRLEPSDVPLIGPAQQGGLRFLVAGHVVRSHETLDPKALLDDKTQVADPASGPVEVFGGLATGDDTAGARHPR